MENIENELQKNQNAGDDKTPQPVNFAALGFPPDAHVEREENGYIVRDQRPDPDPADPGERRLMNLVDPTRQKRNCGKTGPTSNAGRAVSSMNAVRHGCCAATLILENERQEDYDEIQNRWLALYGSPDEKSILYSFIVKTSQSEWFRMRAQREYDYFLQIQDEPMAHWTDVQMKRHDLHMRYMTAAERKFQREYKMLEHHWKTHHKPTAVAPQKPAPEPEPKPTTLPLYVINNGTGEMLDEQRNRYPAPPDYVPKKIIPGEFDDDHPVNLAKKLQERRT